MREQRSIGHHRFRTGQGQDIQRVRRGQGQDIQRVRRGQGQDIQRVRRGKAPKEHRRAQGQKAQVSYFNFFPNFFSLFHDYTFSHLR